ncbi:MAG: site-2 protease family protein [bacterium]|nr:site-2 protease family protein [bacterium]
MPDISSFIFYILILLFSVVIHEVSHGLAALYLGDSTAKYLGRLTLNPLKHLDFFGSLVVPVITSLAGIPFGWAKPVPYNPYNLRDQKYGPAIVGIAGPLSNVLIATVFGLMLRFLPIWVSIAGNVAALNILQGFGEIFLIIVRVNLLLAVFNLVPLPPLDGSKLLFAVLPYRYKYIEGLMEQYGLFLLLFFIFFGFNLIMPIVDVLFRIIVGQRLFF